VTCGGQYFTGPPNCRKLALGAVVPSPSAPANCTIKNAPSRENCSHLPERLKWCYGRILLGSRLEWWMASGRVDYKGAGPGACKGFQQLVALLPPTLWPQSYVGHLHVASSNMTMRYWNSSAALQIKSDSALPCRTGSRVHYCRDRDDD